MEDGRVDQLILFLREHHGGFVNNMVLRDELLAALEELKRYRERPLHCPGCDGDHL